MSSTVDLGVDHPIVADLTDMCARLQQLTDAAWWSLNTVEVAAVAARAEQLLTLAQLLRATTLTQADTLQVADAEGHASTAHWHAHTCTLTKREAHRRTRLAASLDQRPRLVAAMAQGKVNVEQAGVIARALDDLAQLPAEVIEAACARAGQTHTEIVDRAEELLIGHAEEFDAVELRLLGRRVLDVVAPEVAETHEAKLLQAEEDRAAQDVRLTMTPDGHGRVHGRFTLPEAQAAILKKHLLALAAPRHQHATTPAAPTAGVVIGVGDAADAPDPSSLPILRRPSAQRMGAAFAELLERLPAQVTPDAGGVAATIVVTIDYDTLTRQLGDTREGPGVARLDDGTVITAGQARRWACEAGILPAVLGGKSQPLDVGRTRRFHTAAMRHAIAVRDRTCTAEGCDAPPGLCHVHHDHPWSLGGHTNVTTGRLLCPKHHRLAHHPDYQTENLGTGKLRFTRST